MNKKTEKNQAFKTLEAAKQEILRLVDMGAPYRDIATTIFNIDGRSRRFNISQISQFRKERDAEEAKRKQSATTTFASAKADGIETSFAARCFRLFESGKGPVDAVITLEGLSPDEASDLYKKWREMKAESWRDPALPTRVKKIEERLGQLEDIPEYLASYFKEIDDAAQRGRPPDQFDITRAIPPDSFDIWDLLFRSEEILELLDRKSFDPFNNFVCPGCGSKHMVAVKVQCSTCKNEAWFSYFSKKT